MTTQPARDAAAGMVAAIALHTEAAAEAEREAEAARQIVGMKGEEARSQSREAARYSGQTRDLIRALANADDQTPPDAVETDRYGTRVARVTFARAVLHRDAKTHRGPSRWVAYGHTSYAADHGSPDSTRPSFSWDTGRGTSDPAKLEAQRVAAEAAARAWLADHTAAAWLARHGIEPCSVSDLVAIIDAPSFDHYQGRADVVAGWRAVLAGPEPLDLGDGRIHSWHPFRDAAPADRDPWRTEPGAFGPMGHGPDDRIPEAVRAFMERHRADVLAWFVSTLRRSDD